MSIEDRQLDIETNLIDLGPESWREQIRQISVANGFFEELGDEHYAGFLEAGNNLFVTFENAQRVRETAFAAEPRGYAYARHDGWSHLAIFSKSVSWFRDEAIYTFFDPKETKRSLGRYAILSLIDYAKKKRLPSVYLGYWIKSSPKMRYKAEYRPLEILIDDRWLRVM